jgi:hypothetical protein
MSPCHVREHRLLAQQASEGRRNGSHPNSCGWEVCCDAQPLRARLRELGSKLNIRQCWPAKARNSVTRHKSNVRLSGKLTGNFTRFDFHAPTGALAQSTNSMACEKNSRCDETANVYARTGNFHGSRNRTTTSCVSVVFSHTCLAGHGRDLFSLDLQRRRERDDRGAASVGASGRGVLACAS